MLVSHYNYHCCLKYIRITISRSLTARMKPMLYYSIPTQGSLQPLTHHSTNQSIQKPLKPPLPRRRNIQAPTLPPTRPNRTITLKPIQQPRLSILRLVGIAASQTSRSISPCMHRTAADIDVRRVSIAISPPLRDRRSRGNEGLSHEESFSVDTGV